MKLKRYFTELELKENSIVKIDQEEYHHLKNVMRTRVNDKIILFNRDGYDAEAVITKLDKLYGEAKILKAYKNESEPKCEVCLMQAVCKGDKLSFITQKITELGASKMVVYYSDYTDIKDKTSKLDKLDRVSISACKQCGRSKPLTIEGVDSFISMVNKAKSYDKVFVPYENAEGVTLYGKLLKNAKYDKICVIIGAEGGFSENEIKIMQENGFEIVTLGKRILRTETASIVSVANIVFACEENKWKRKYVL